MKKLIAYLVCSWSLLSSSVVSASDIDVKQFLKEANRIGQTLHKNTQGKSLIEKLLFIEDFAQTHQNNPIATEIIQQGLSVEYSFAGLHQKALMTGDLNAKTNQNAVEDLREFTAKNAVDEILKHSDKHQIVMINEAHDRGQHRVLTYRLLSGLWQQGYRYFAAETLNSNISSDLKEGIVGHNAGYYTREALYAQLVMSAYKMGFEIIAYDNEIEAVLNTTEERETNAAFVINQKVFEKDPNAKIVIHVGYSHINEQSWLASKLKDLTKLETLTVDQTSRMEKSQVQFEHPTYQSVAKINAMNAPVVLTKGQNLWSSEPNNWDVSVIWPRTQYIGGRPSWASLDRKTHRVGDDLCLKQYPCMVEVFRFNKENEVPSDRVIISEKDEGKVVFLNSGKNIIITRDKRGEVISKIKVDA